MTMPVEQNWNARFSVRSDRKWLGFNSVAVTYAAAMADFALLLFASAAGHIAYQDITFGFSDDPSVYIGIGLLVATMFVLAMAGAHTYRAAELVSFRRQLTAICTILPAVVVFLLTIAFFMKVGSAISRGAIASTTVLSLAGLLGLRVLWRSYLKRAAAHAAFPTHRVLLICPEATAVEPLSERATRSGLVITQTMRIGRDGSAAGPSLLEACSKHGIDDVDEVLIVWGDYGNLKVLDECLVTLRQFCLPVSVMFTGLVGEIVQGFAHGLGENCAFQTHRPPLDLFERAVKRTFDIAFSIGALLVTLPMCIVIAIAIKLDSRGPIFFWQSRKGYSGKSFRILKFRSMSVMEDGSDVRQATRNDPRVTRVGAFIRSSSLDELPQFWNVLRGEMSVVGPRPHALAHDDFYGTLIAQYASRRHVKPGLTGWAQINGYRGETPTVDRMAERVRHDIWYINNWSLWLDLRIVLQTMLGIKDRKNVY
ncbi:exopolysaccharide biosynthesis polyprenyl glycosylphosphotransferase (plasmid) [Rhizobium grahamii]|uniref:Exopolysaccharide biosynthesis polyprenyl glycosylphosphotransferase n=1 Tax=Rhizobium grahamii TaxID=1120045 RepID=A0A5Q0CD14_9HYPH|nr:MULTISPECIES: exopolysaccharide biosynthesis polyprenyl glycosylphosphotransferase [Rhizobium]QFY63686.1 exopolysaccharide biosynthesis polyprenyl glycosylphosphotransferase [Rhizobium grahamii]QRM51549.1 exopolysaccharide biosynthesis polyprenyl glycosylphosphotransferase [Rhizobium sp. BG6]